MKHLPISPFIGRIITFSLCLFLFGQTTGQNDIRIVIEPNPVQVGVNDSVQVTVKILDGEGKEIEEGQSNLFAIKGGKEAPSMSTGIMVSKEKMVSGRLLGEYDLVAYWFDGKGKTANEMVKATVLPGPLSKVMVKNLPEEIYVGSIIPLELEVTDIYGNSVQPSDMKIRSADSQVAEVDNLLEFYARKPGSTNLIVMAGDTPIEIPIKVVKNPVSRVELTTPENVIRTGDVIRLTAKAFDKRGKEIPQVPFYFSASADNEAAAGATAIIEQDGRFVAEKPGMYTVVASSGERTAVRSIRVLERTVQREITLVGQGRVASKRTSDFWVWEGVDGKDYAVTGTWGADGKAYFWNVTDPTDIQLIDSIQVDARTVNDVKLSEDGKICVISREGASSRKNGIVILDVTNPYDVQIISTFTEGLTGGVHNLFIYKDHVYALSAGQRYDVINIEDPAKPYKVGKFELETPGRSIHDVWIVDGLAYSSNWTDGVVIVDVGNGIAGGSPSNPVEVARARVKGDANHAAFPYRSPSTGKFYVVAGDEIFQFLSPGANSIDDIVPRGYLHFMDFTDPKNPVEVARYEVPEAGSHNFWIEDDTLYIGYYNGGLRVVDISGDLMGDLYRQGREMGHYLPADAEGFVANKPMTWGAQPHKGHVFFSDFHSGLWAVKVEPPKEEKEFKN